jgi:hypothetical protein
VATGAVDIPVKLPAPVLGTEEHAGPKSVVVAAAEPPAALDDAIGEDAIEEDEAAGAEDPPAAAEEDELELHAAVDRARPAAMPLTARRRYFTGCSFEWFLCRYFGSRSGVRRHAVPWMRAVR